MRDRLRGLRLLLALSFAAAPRQAALVVASRLSGQVAWLTAMYAHKLLVDAIVRTDLDGALRAGVLMAVTEGVSYMCFRMHYISREVEERTALVVDQRLIALTAGIPTIEHHERPEYAKQVDLLRDDRMRLAGVANTVASTLYAIVGLAGASLLLARISPWLLLLAPVGAVTMLTGRWSTAIQERAREMLVEPARLRERLFEIATSSAAAKELRVFGLEREIASRHLLVAREVDRAQGRAAWKSRAIDLAGSLASAVGLAGAVAFVLLRAVSGLATAGDVVLTLRMANQLTFAISTIGGTTNYLAQALKAAGRYLWLVDHAERTAAAVPKPSPLPRALTRGVTLEDVSFGYSGTERRVLDSVSLTLPAGSVVALVGENGAGKTTLAKLLSGFYQPDAGRILVDGIDLRALDPATWRARISAAFQDFQRFELLARETVGVGDLRFLESPPHVHAALERAGAADVLGALPAGLETQLGTEWESGVELSGGQWQKLALARALMRERPLLTIFDEPTAALDADTEHALFERFACVARDPERRGAVTLLISHRFSTVRMADHIVVLQDGRVAEQGSHEQLTDRAGLYAELYHLQARAYTI